MNETTRIFVPEGGSNDALTTALLANNGGGFGGGMWNNPIWAIVFLAALRNGGIFGDNNGNGGRCQLSQIQEQLQTIQGNNSLMSAIQGGTNEIRSLANTINCDVNAVQSAINGVQASICSVGNQVGMTSAQVVNAIQSGNTAIANQIAQCCCDNKLLTTQMGYENRINNLQQSQLIQNGFAQIGYANAEQSCAIKQNNTDNTNRVLAKLDAIEDSRKDREIASLTAALTEANSRANLAPIYKALSDIECKQPKTESVYAPSVVGVPACVAAQYQLGLYGGFPYAQQRGNVFS